TGETGDPGESLLARRQIFVLLPVGARYDEAVEAAPVKLRTQGSDARRHCGALIGVVECLEAGFVHRGTLTIPVCGATQACRAYAAAIPGHRSHSFLSRRAARAQQTACGTRIAAMHKTSFGRTPILTRSLSDSCPVYGPDMQSYAFSAWVFRSMVHRNSQGQRRNIC